jgi:hypothetical protein
MKRHRRTHEQSLERLKSLHPAAASALPRRWPTSGGFGPTEKRLSSWCPRFSNLPTLTGQLQIRVEGTLAPDALLGLTAERATGRIEGRQPANS